MMDDGCCCCCDESEGTKQQPSSTIELEVPQCRFDHDADRWINQDIIVVPEPPQSHRPIQSKRIPLLIIDGSSLVSQSNDYSSRTVVTMRESHLLHCRVRAASRSLIHS